MPEYSHERREKAQSERRRDREMGFVRASTRLRLKSACPLSRVKSRAISGLECSKYARERSSKGLKHRSEMPPWRQQAKIEVSGVLAIAFSNGGKHVVVGASDRSVRLCNASTGTQVARFDGHAYEVAALAVARDNATFASGGGDRTVFHWNVATGQTVRRLQGHTSRVNAVALNPESTLLISGEILRRLGADPQRPSTRQSDSGTCARNSACPSRS